MQIRTVAAILMVFVVALLFLNNFLKSGLIFQISIAMMVIAVLVYFISHLKK